MVAPAAAMRSRACLRCSSPRPLTVSPVNCVLWIQQVEHYLHHADMGFEAGRRLQIAICDVDHHTQASPPCNVSITHILAIPT